MTYCVPDLQAIESAYVGDLGYRAATHYRITEAEASAWGAPDACDRPALVLQPASGEPVLLRFIEDSAARGWRALRTFGWNVTEFVVQDVSALARRLERSAFEIIGPPKPLTRFPMIRAMQAMGPAGECCYFTEIGPGSGLELPAARAFVGRVFIVVGAGPQLPRLCEPFASFANTVETPVATPIAVISRAHGLPPDTLHRHTLVRLGAGTLIELDEYPPTARERGCRAGALPPGMAAVTFSVDDLGGPAGAPPRSVHSPAVHGRVACMRGGAGEIIELLAPHSS